MKAEEIIERTRDLVQEELGVESDKIVPDATFENLGGDSLDIVELVMAVESEFDIDIGDEDAEKAMETFGALTEYLTTRLADW